MYVGNGAGRLSCGRICTSGSASDSVPTALCVRNSCELSKSLVYIGHGGRPALAGVAAGAASGCHPQLRAIVHMEGDSS